MKILVTGGAGYIGSHTACSLRDKNHDVIVYDNLINGHKKAVERIGVKLIVGNIEDEEKLSKILSQEKIDIVMHFAAFLEAGESMQEPAKYFRNNDCNGLSLLEAMRKSDVKKIIFSSSAAVYGIPDKIPVAEDATLNPVNFYGESKLVFERLLSWYHQLFGLNFISLRYFNAAGASKKVNIGEDHSPETHLIPNIMKTVLRQRESFSLFGTDYDTKDGTCIRDYIHVDDLANAHILAAEALLNGKQKDYYNLGNGNGYSNREIIKMVKKITKKDFKIIEEKRRSGDPPILIASSKKIKKEIGWESKYELEDIISSAWEWHSKNPNGFQD